METKKRIRKQILEKRDALTETQRKMENEAIYHQITLNPTYNQADKLLVFASFGSEADTFRIAEKALKDGKNLYYPLVEGKEMEFYHITGFDELIPGFHGILEPKATDETRFHPEEDQNIVMLMPGVAFDHYGGRIGYGGGFYDKYLKKLRTDPKLRVTTIAIAFSCQMLKQECIPREEHDISPDYIITPEETISFLIRN